MNGRKISRQQGSRKIRDLPLPLRFPFPPLSPPHPPLFPLSSRTPFGTSSALLLPLQCAGIQSEDVGSLLCACSLHVAGHPPSPPPQPDLNPRPPFSPRAPPPAGYAARVTEVLSTCSAFLLSPPFPPSNTIPLRVHISPLANYLSFRQLLQTFFLLWVSSVPFSVCLCLLDFVYTCLCVSASAPASISQVISKISCEVVPLCLARDWGVGRELWSLSFSLVLQAFCWLHPCMSFVRSSRTPPFKSLKPGARPAVETVEHLCGIESNVCASSAYL